MNQKILWFDVETTGLYGWKHDIIQFAYIVEINHEVKEEGVFTMQPMNFEGAIDERALVVHGMTRAHLIKFQHARAGHDQIMAVLNKYINPNDKNDKFTPACYNAKFDTEFLQANFKKHGRTDYGKYLDYHALDPMAIAVYLRYYGAIKTENCKLATVARYFGIEFQAHDAMEDIRATRMLAHKLHNFFTVA